MAFIFFLFKPRPINHQNGVHILRGVQLGGLVDRTHRTWVRCHRVLGYVSADMRRDPRGRKRMCGTLVAASDAEPDSAECQVRQMGRSVEMVMNSNIH